MLISVDQMVRPATTKSLATWWDGPDRQLYSDFLYLKFEYTNMSIAYEDKKLTY